MYSLHRFYLMALDPVHVGTGGYRLGRVDLSITREPGTNLPKVPGTSLAGAARSYAARRYNKLQCAGQGTGKLKHCGLATCPICYTFGTVRGTDGGNAGTVSLADAQLLFFPVFSMAGPVWATTPTRLTGAGWTVRAPTLANRQFATTLPKWTKPLNTGWLLLEHQGGTVALTAPSGLANEDTWQAIANRVVLVDDQLWSHIVNSNLEVRTSVSINPTTGAAEEGALYTYEALPRATWLWCDIVQDDYRTDGSATFPIVNQFDGQDNAGLPLNATWNGPLDVVRAGVDLIEYLGVGGMGTRGFGRMKRVANERVTHA